MNYGQNVDLHPSQLIQRDAFARLNLPLRLAHALDELRVMGKKPVFKVLFGLGALPDAEGDRYNLNVLLHHY